MKGCHCWPTVNLSKRHTPVDRECYATRIRHATPDCLATRPYAGITTSVWRIHARIEEAGACAARVTNLYHLMEAAYRGIGLHEHSRSLGHVPLTGRNPRGGAKKAFEPA